MWELPRWWLHAVRNTEKKRMMIGIRSILTSVLAIAIIVIIGLINFDLILEIWVKVLIGVLFMGVIVSLARRFRA